MNLDQKHITTIRMHDAKGSDVRLTRDGTDYLLSLASSSNIVNITLSHQDVRKLWEQLVRLGTDPCWTAPEPTADFKSLLFNNRDRAFTEHMAALFAKMAQQLTDSTGKS